MLSARAELRQVRARLAEILNAETVLTDDTMRRPDIAALLARAEQLERAANRSAAEAGQAAGWWSP